jgi:AAA+ ATPase superfamily predicted ATPase
MTKFIGREKEFESLIGLAHKKNASLVVIRGRRRIGKSRLAEEYAKKFKKAIILSGIPPVDGVTAEDQREEFLRQLQEYKLPVHRSDDWGNLFFDH